MSYVLLRQLHIACVVLSGCGFALRGLWMLTGSPWLHERPVRVIPHLVDTVLLGSAIAMVVLSGQYPLVDGWLTAKLVGLLIYIGLGTMALKRGRTREQRLGYFVGALLAFAYIVSVAVLRNPWGLVVWLR
ncbi:SirB2 family protein [Accumulibacter sp.]|uniref:SirB2 family protein n=1 Tax=Accumulibacter sp. TaxID=2053492 RepID=UPI0025F59B16|nr:SirB2 family protein [Accumulibacter sp.]MCM8595064.1 SirB2 family protein [Accumulibacter sp.]MCM8625447.1 SirB2 family protein [Accumulibacter sp.]MDS4049210.1 SirB2 family protein [Accumulibacter sp.]